MMKLTCGCLLLLSGLLSVAGAIETIDEWTEGTIELVTKPVSKPALLEKKDNTTHVRVSVFDKTASAYLNITRFMARCSLNPSQAPNESYHYRSFDRKDDSSRFNISLLPIRKSEKPDFHEQDIYSNVTLMFNSEQRFMGYHNFTDIKQRALQFNRQRMIGLQQQLKVSADQREQLEQEFHLAIAATGAVMANKVRKKLDQLYMPIARLSGQSFKVSQSAEIAVNSSLITDFVDDHSQWLAKYSLTQVSQGFELNIRAERKQVERPQCRNFDANEYRSIGRDSICFSRASLEAVYHLDSKGQIKHFSVEKHKVKSSGSEYHHCFRVEHTQENKT